MPAFRMTVGDFSGLGENLAADLPVDPQLVLVTDLDGTLLDGPSTWRRRFYAWLLAERRRVLHVFCTGRDLRSVAAVLTGDPSHGLQAPHLVISDVGSTVACGVSLRPLLPAVAPIEARWSGKANRVAALLAGAPGVSPQPISSDRRLAYYYDPERFDSALIPRIEAQGVDCLLSDDRYLDVLPAGVNKGSTLEDLLVRLRIPRERVVTAGDTLNDLAMFQTGLAGVMVGNAEPALRRQLSSLPRTYLAQGHGCQGIVEGLRHHGFGDLLADFLAGPLDS
ncbi:MAG: HAD family hydrolase [Cyanobacteriota bacterium]|nr:HAD family hydrolase [Cyanobacteriota bacterium]